jgi:hypothetical protein
MTLLTYLFILVFLIGLYFYSKNADPKYAEGLTNNNSLTKRCPNLLIQKGSRFYLYNSKIAQVPGVNPVEFDNLEDYTEFLDWQRSQGIRCPVLYLQETYDAQGKRVYKVRPSVSEPQAGLPPSILAPIGIASQQQPTLMETGLDPVGEPAYPNPTLLVDATRNDPPYNKVTKSPICGNPVPPQPSGVSVNVSEPPFVVYPPIVYPLLVCNVKVPPAPDIKNPFVGTEL